VSKTTVLLRLFNIQKRDFLSFLLLTYVFLITVWR